MQEPAVIPKSKRTNSPDFVSGLGFKRDGLKTRFVTIFNIFRRDEKDEQKDRKRSGSYIEDLFAKSDEVVSQKY